MATAGPCLPASMASLEKPERDAAANRVSRLTKRHKECLRLVAQGYTSKEIGRQLGISYSTVDNHLLAAVQLLEVPGRAEAARKLADYEQAVAREQQRAPAESRSLDAVGPANPHAAGIGQELPRQPRPVAETTNPADENPQASNSRWTRNLSRLLPPIGGRENDLSGSQRIYAIARISLFSTLMFVACVIVVRTCFVALR
ncbi:LuxR C-terminal-related transcriptional regulator [Sphingomonas sp. CJ20]